MFKSCPNLIFVFPACFISVGFLLYTDTDTRPASAASRIAAATSHRGQCCSRIVRYAYTRCCWAALSVALAAWEQVSWLCLAIEKKYEKEDAL